MSKPAFDPNQPFESADGGSKKPKFDPNKPFDVADQAEQKSFGQKALDTVVEAGRAIDSATGAPTRAAIGKLQEGGSIGDAGQAFSNQFLEHPEFAPTGKQIAQRAGIGETTLKEVFPNLTDEQIGDALAAMNPAFKLTQYAKPTEITASGAAGFGVDLAADWTNLIPAVGQVKKGVQATELGAKAARAVGKTTDLISKGAKEVGKRAISISLGPDMPAINRYLDRADQIKSAKSVEEIKNSIDSTMQGFFDSVENAKISKDDAKEALKEIQSKIKDTVNESNFQFRVDKADVNEQLKLAQSKLDDAYAGEVSRLQSVKSPTNLVDDVSASIQELKQKVKQGSEESYKILDNDTKAYSVRNAAPVLRKMADDMNILGYESAGKAGLVAPGQYGAPVASSGPVTTQSIGVQNELRRFAELLEQTPERVPARELKKMLQQIDNSEKAVYGQPGFDSRVSQAYKAIRATIDDAIKAENPAYRAKMEEVAANTGLLSRSIDRFGDPRMAASKLNSIGSATALEDRKLLSELGSKTSRDFDSPVSEYLMNQRVLKNPDAMAGIKGSLPETSQFKKAKETSDLYARPETSKEYVKNALQKEKLPEQLSQAQERLQGSVKKLDESTEALAPFKSLTSVNSENVIRGLMGAPGKKIEMRRMVEDLSKMSQKDFVNMIDDARAAQQFNGEFRIGSRNVNLWAIIGFFTGGPLGGGAGAALGAMTDRFGPALAQKILDGALKIKGAPTVSKIKALKLPQPAELYLIKELGKGLSGPELWVARGQDELKETDSSLDPEYLERYQKTKDGRSDLIRAGEPSMSPAKRQEIINKIKSSEEYKQFLKQKEKQEQGKEPDQAKAQKPIKFPLTVKKDGFTAVVRNPAELEEAKSEGWS